MSDATTGATLAYVRQALAAVGASLPEPAEPVASYRTAVRSGDTVYTSGHIPLVDGAPVVCGRVDDEVGVDDAAAAAGQAAMALMASAFAAVAEADRLRPLKLTVYVASAPGFHGIPKVADGASTILAAAFGELPARSAVGVASLPLGVPVEVEAIFTVIPGP